MKKFFHLLLLAMEVSFLIGMLAFLFFNNMEIADSFVSKENGELKLRLAQEVHRDNIWKCQVYYSRGQKKNTYDGAKIMAMGKTIPLEMAMKLPSGTVSFRVDFHYNGKLPLPNKPPRIEQITWMGKSLNRKWLSPVVLENNYAVAWEYCPKPKLQGHIEIAIETMIGSFLLIYGFIVFAFLGIGKASLCGR